MLKAQFLPMILCYSKLIIADILKMSTAYTVKKPVSSLIGRIYNRPKLLNYFSLDREYFAHADF